MSLSILLALVSLGGTLVGLLTAVHVVICVALLLIVLFQQKGRSADLASAFGGGPMQANVAALSAEDVVTKATKYGALLFMVTSLLLALFPPGRDRGAVFTEPADDVPAVTAPAEPGLSATPEAQGSALDVTPVPADQPLPAGEVVVPAATDGAAPADEPPAGDAPAGSP